MSEVFGPTFQGEGPHMGEPALFIRLGRCNLSCSWCDTPYTWDWTRYDPKTELSRRTVAELLEWAVETAGPYPPSGLHRQGPRLVVLTGGEPMLQRHRLGSLTTVLAAAGFHVDVETNGTLPVEPEMAVRTYVVSPKLENSGLARFQRLVEGALDSYDRLGPAGACLKFVVRNERELDEVAQVAAMAPHLPVYVMPEARTVLELLSGTGDLADAVVARGWYFTTRLHLVAWGPSRGH